MKKTLTTLFLSLLLTVPLLFVVQQSVGAQGGAGCSFETGMCTPEPADEDVAICSDNDERSDGATECDCTETPLTSENCEIINYIVIGTNVLTVIAGLAIIGGIITAGYQYMTAEDNPGKVNAARTRVVWALVALVLLLFSYAILNFLVPGGVL